MSLQPPRHRPATPLNPEDFVRPLGLASLLICAAFVVAMAIQALVVWQLCDGPFWRWMLLSATEQQFPPSVLWILRKPVDATLWLMLSAIPAVLSSWGFARRRRWGLWSYVALLWLSALANFAVAGWLDSVVADVIGRIVDPGTLREARTQHILMSLALFGGAFALLVAQGWLAWRLLRPDIRSCFH